MESERKSVDEMTKAELKRALLHENPTATEGVKTMTDDMKKMLLKHLMVEKGGVAV